VVNRHLTPPFQGDPENQSPGHPLSWLVYLQPLAESIMQLESTCPTTASNIAVISVQEEHEVSKEYCEMSHLFK
jgi:hypothetical protein